MPAVDPHVPLAVLIERELVHHYGPMISNDELRKALGYPSKEAFRQSIVRNTVPVPIFDVEGRRGKFALAADVAIWLVQQRQRARNLVEFEAAASRTLTIEEAP